MLHINFALITCSADYFILWDEFSVEKSVIWVAFDQQRFIIRNVTCLVAVVTVRKFDIYIESSITHR